MKKVQRILALAGVILLAAMYGSTLFFAVSGNPDSAGWFKASIACTIIVPVFLYANVLVYRVLKNRDEKPGHADGEHSAREKKNKN